MRSGKCRQCVSSDLKLKSRASFEYIVSQIRSHSSQTILCVADGCELLIFESVNDIPLNLCLTGGYKIRNADIETIEYHWKSESNGSFFTFFDANVNKVLLEREANYLRSKPVIVTDSNASYEVTKKYVKIL